MLRRMIERLHTWWLWLGIWADVITIAGAAAYFLGFWLTS